MLPVMGKACCLPLSDENNNTAIEKQVLVPPFKLTELIMARDLHA